MKTIRDICRLRSDGDYRFAWCFAIVLMLIAAPFILVFKEKIPSLILVPFGVGTIVIVVFEWVHSRSITALLVVSADEGQVMGVTYSLRGRGLRLSVKSVSTSQDAKRYLQGDDDFSDRTRFPIPRVVLLDLGNGTDYMHDFLLWLRNQPGLSHIGVILMSQFLSHRDERKAIGTDDIKTRWVEKDDLEREILHLLSNTRD